MFFHASLHNKRRGALSDDSRSTVMKKKEPWGSSKYISLMCRLIDMSIACPGFVSRERPGRKGLYFFPAQVVIKPV